MTRARGDRGACQHVRQAVTREGGIWTQRCALCRALIGQWAPRRAELVRRPTPRQARRS